MSILCYHEVEPNWRSPLAIEPAAFAEQCAWLARHRTVLPLEAAVDRLRPDGALPAPFVALTFDDAFSGVFEHALPILVRHQLPATVFVVARTVVDPPTPVDWVDTPPPWPLRTIGLDDLVQMQHAGVRIGSHSYGHHDLTTLTEAECERDLRRSREALEDALGTPVPFLAYPRGRHAAHVRRAAERAGYTHAFALPEAPEPRSSFAVPRVGVYPGNGLRSLQLKTRPSYLRVRTSPAFPLLRKLARRPPVEARRAG